MKREISKVGKEMLEFQEKLAAKHKYKPIPIDMFMGDLRKKYTEALPEWCHNSKQKEIALYSVGGIKICSGFKRIVIGDYGAFIEISPDQICKSSLMCKPGQEYRYNDIRYAKNVKYLWLTTKNKSDCKIYLQKKKVDYADYIPGMYYVSPYEVFITEFGII